MQHPAYQDLADPVRLQWSDPTVRGGVQRPEAPVDPDHVYGGHPGKGGGVDPLEQIDECGTGKPLGQGGDEQQPVGQARATRTRQRRLPR